MALKTKYSPLQHLSLENIYTAFAGFSPRDKILALGGIVVLFLILLFLPFSLVSGKIHSMQRSIETLQQGTREVEVKIADYHRAKEEIAALEKKLGAVGSLTSKVEGVAKKIGMTVDQLKEKPVQETDFFEINSVEVRISGANLQQLTDFFNEIETDPSATMRFRRVQIKPKFSNRQLLDLSCEIATFSLKKEA